jgi:DNA-binding NarL/FixJ family response regulator
MAEMPTKVATKEPRRWSMHFWHEAVYDVVTMTFDDCVLDTPEAATDFMRVVFEHIQRHKTPADVIIDYSGLIVRAGAAHQFGVERTEFARRFVKRSFRLNVNTATSRTALYTSAVLRGAQINMLTTREEALAALLAERVRAPLPGDPPVDAAAVDAVLASLGLRDRASPATAHGLSQRELDVSRLLARAKTNKEIGALLGISPRTVKLHVAHIFDKLGVHSRAGAAIWLVEHGLVS